MGQVVNVSVLFTDLVGSTALSSSVSPAEADGLRREHFAVLRRAVAEVDGTEVKNLGDGLMVVFPTASTALACAVGMQQATEADNCGREVPFGLRVGVAAGEASVEDGDYFGDPVVEAARLCALCDSGQILATDVVRATAGRRNPHRCVPVGDLELKGLPEPVPVVEVTWEPLEAAPSRGRVPLPARLSGRPAAGLVGRSTELSSLADAFKRVAGGGGREVVVVSGEAGLGKTTLVAEAARTAFDAGACVLFGHAEEDLATPYGMFAEAFSHLVTHASDDDLRAYVADCGGDLARIVPALARRLPDVDAPSSSDGETERYLLYSAVVGLLRHVARERPVVLVVDDLQWADTASLQLLRHVVGEDPGLGLLVLGTFRDTEVAAGHPLVDALAALWRMDRVTRVDLQGLDDRGVVDLLEATAGHELDEPGVELAHALYRETDGNPFFLSEVLRHLVETGALYRDDTTGRWVSDLTLEELRLPDSVREVVGARVARLGPQATRILSTAAVIGRDFDLELLTRATEADEDDVLDLLEAAEAAALVREPASVAGRFSFTHALIQRTLYQDLSANRRARTHERIAEALEDLTAGRPGDRVGELAHHWALAMRPTEVAKAIDYAAKAGAAALEQLAPAEAVRWYTQALELLGPDGEPHRRAEILVGLGEAQREDACPQYRDTLLEAAALADETDDVRLLAEAVIANNRKFQSTTGSADEDRIAAIRRALERLSDDEIVFRARVLSLLAVELSFVAPLEERLTLARSAVQLARSSRDPLAMVQSLNLGAISVHVPRTLDERFAWLREAAGLAERMNDPGWQFSTFNNLRHCMLTSGDRDGCDRINALQDRLIEHISPINRWTYAYDRAYFALLDGDLEASERLAKAALSIGLDAGEPDAFLFFGIQLSNVREAQGRFAELLPGVEEGVRVNPGLAGFRASLAVACAEAGDLERCRSLLTSEAASEFEIIEEPGWLQAIVQWAKAAVAARDRSAASLLLELLKPYRDQVVFTAVSVHPAACHYIARLEQLLGQFDDASASFARARAIHQRLRAPQFVARTEIRWAQLLLERNQGDDHNQARALAASAQDASTGRPGWDWIERDADAVLERLS